MAKEIKVVGLGGSLAQRSSSLAALRIALAGAKEAGAETELFAISELDLPMYAPGAEVPDSARRLCDAAYAAQGMLWASPLYHGTVSGSFKNALDWLQPLGQRKPPYLTDKVIGLIGVAGGAYALQAVNTMDFAVRALRGWAVPLIRPLPSASQIFDEQGSAGDADIDQQLRHLGSEVVRAARQFVSNGYCDYSHP